MQVKKTTRNDTYILVPAYQPDEELIKILINLKNEDFDIIVVNDGSSDKCKEIFAEAEKYATVLKHDINRGKGAALRLGFSYINLHHENHNYVITCDADGQHAIEDIVSVNEKLHETDNVVFGVRDFKKDTPKEAEMAISCLVYLEQC